MSIVSRLSGFFVAGAALCAVPAAQAATFQTLYSFSGGADGSGPYGKPLLDKLGNLYGATVSGGAGQGGTVFQYNLASGKLTTLYSFTTFAATGSTPAAGLVLGAKGYLYGTTETGGNAVHCSEGCGTLFELNPATSTLTTLHAFSGPGDGSVPGARLTLVKGVLYGSTISGGYEPAAGFAGYGTVFKYDLIKKAFTTLHQFSVGSDNDGAGPQGALVADTSGKLYGTASEGGPHGSGVVYEIDPSTNAFTLLHAFDYHVDGSGPESDLILRTGMLVGTARVGGPAAASDGVLFSIDAANSAFADLYDFQGGSQGLFPSPGVVIGPKGLLYGTTDQGGSSGAGTVFAINPVTHKFTLVHDFTVSDGVGPTDGLVRSGNVLYGVTSGGGRGHGTIFMITP
jgi:uncharacterized repeat protein (TIGR03803 family)